MSYRLTIPRLLLTSCALAVVMAPVTHGASAPEAVTEAAVGATFSCVSNVFGGDDCFGPVTVAAPAFGQRTATLDLDASFAWQTFLLRVEVCSGSGWTVHITDSPTGNGGGGDGGSTRHDAEAQALDATLTVLRSDIGASFGQPLVACQFGGPHTGSGCLVQDWIVRNDQFIFDANARVSNPTNTCNNPYIFEFPPYDEADSEDTSHLYADNLYVGLNRTYGSASRTGSGVQRACFFLTTDAAPNFTTVTSECGF